LITKIKAEYEEVQKRANIGVVSMWRMFWLVKWWFLIMKFRL